MSHRKWLTDGLSILCNLTINQFQFDKFHFFSFIPVIEFLSVVPVFICFEPVRVTSFIQSSSVRRDLTVSVRRYFCLEYFQGVRKRFVFFFWTRSSQNWNRLERKSIEPKTRLIRKRLKVNTFSQSLPHQILSANELMKILRTISYGPYLVGHILWTI